MGCRERIAISTNGVRWKAGMASLVAVLALAAPAGANVGYELDSSMPSISLGATTKVTHGLAVDQANGRLYVAVITENPQTLAPGEIARFEIDGTPAGTFTGGGSAYFVGVAVDPATQGFYASEGRFETPLGTVGTMRMDPFTAGGAMGTPFALNNLNGVPNLATDSSSDIYYPNDLANTVQVFSSTGTLEESITCSGCPGGGFGRPSSVAIGSDDDLYVVDLAPNRVLKLTLSGGSYQYASTVQSGGGAASVAVDPSTDDVLVGALPSGRNYHILAYDATGTQFDDFGFGLFPDPPPPGDAAVAFQLAVDETTHELYAGTLGAVYIFDKTTTTPPSVSTNPASAVGQQVATLNATVNAKGHAVLECDFKYVDEAEFLANGFANAETLPCSKKPAGTSNTAVTANATGLSPATKYRFRAVAASYAGSTNGNEGTFTTLPSVPPSVFTDPATNVTQASATLNGRVNPKGGTVTDCHFDFGTTSAYGTSAACKSGVGPVTTEVPQSLDLSGLAAATTYHYRLVVTTNAGSVEGADAAFTTLAPQAAPPALPIAEDEPPPPTAPLPMRCRSGFVKKLIRGKYVCVRKCPKGTVRRRVRGKYRCVKRRPARRAGRR
jgi:hypothetical protein